MSALNDSDNNFDETNQPEEQTDEDELDAAGDDALQGLWMPNVGEDIVDQNINFIANQGPRIHLPTTASPLEYFQLFATGEFFNIIVKETNRYATQWIEGHQEYI
ncbi:transposase [Plakobranchus ocellatus]|uniref:Transposase n=1 Tax=Plakobranchus ocellatus TaxID=259542 RepID=A0AAV3ZCW5_9GAST|nr:transposase [Plakobranchus ocellatus]